MLFFISWKNVKMCLDKKKVPKMFIIIKSLLVIKVMAVVLIYIKLNLWLLLYFFVFIQYMDKYGLKINYIFIFIVKSWELILLRLSYLVCKVS